MAPKKKTDGKVVAKKPAAKTASMGTVRIDPNLPLLPGNTVTFVAEGREGLTMAKVLTGRGSSLVKTSSGVAANEERVSKIIETGHDEITVEFYEDGKLYASGTWPVG